MPRGRVAVDLNTYYKTKNEEQRREIIRLKDLLNDKDEQIKDLRDLNQILREAVYKDDK